MTPVAVIDPGPIPYEAIELTGDPDLESGLRRAGYEPASTCYRLIELPLALVGDTYGMSNWQHVDTYKEVVTALRRGGMFPPIVVMPTTNGVTLVDGVSRTYAHWLLRRASIRAYELLTAERT